MYTFIPFLIFWSSNLWYIDDNFVSFSNVCTDFCKYDSFVINSCTASFCIVHDECARDLPQVLACMVPAPIARLMWHTHDFVTECLPILTTVWPETLHISLSGVARTVPSPLGRGNLPHPVPTFSPIKHLCPQQQPAMCCCRDVCIKISCGGVGS